MNIVNTRPPPPIQTLFHIDSIYFSFYTEQLENVIGNLMKKY